MRKASLLAASALALAGMGANVPPASTAPGQPASPDDRRRWLRSRYTSPRYRGLRKSTGTHKQNRRRLLAGRTR